MPTLPLKPVVDVYYQLQAISAPRSGFNLGAIVGNTLFDRAKKADTVYESVDEMIEAGYSLTDPEVLAAQIYFASSSRPGQLFVHTWVDQATPQIKQYIGPIANGYTVTIGEDTYTVGDGTSDTTTISDVLTYAERAGATTYEYVEATGTMTIILPSAELGANSNAPTLEVVGAEASEVKVFPGLSSESAVETVAAMRTGNSEWYAVAFCKELSGEDVKAVAAYLEASSIYSTFFFNSSDEAVLASAEGNLFEQLKGLKYSRTFGIATTQPFTHVGAMAYPMGKISDKANSSFTVGLKSLTGCAVDSFTSAQVKGIEANYGNVYINRGSYYDILEEGRVFSGAWFDEIIQLDKLVNTVQLDVMDLLYQNPKIAQTEGGVSRIMATISNGCKNAVKTGFVAPGKWNGVEVLNLVAGDYLPDGYLIQAESIDEQSQADRDARKCPYIYVALKLAGAIQSVVVQIDVNR